MRWKDEYIGLIGVTFGFGALVLWMQDASAVVVATFAAAALIMLVAMAARASRTPKVLVVGDPDQALVGVFETRLDETGFGVQTCPGPHNRVGGCPVLRGEPCPIPGRPLAAVIVRPARESFAFPPCDNEFGIPSFDLNERSRHPAAGATDGDERDVERAIGRLTAIRNS